MRSGTVRSTEIIASSANPAIRMVRSLQRRKIRQQERAFVVEGIRAVDDVLAAGVLPTAVYAREDFDVEGELSIPSGVPLRTVTRVLFDTLTDVPNPQGILAVVPMIDEEPVPLPTTGYQPLILLLDAIRDPGNLGTLLRSAAGAGVDHVVIGPETVDPYHPRAVRAGMGAHVRIPFSHQSWTALPAILGQYDVVALAEASGEAVYDSVAWTASTVMIVGGEAHGPSAHAQACAMVRVSIPLLREVESLNAGVAGSLLVFEAARQRRARKSAIETVI